MQRHPIAFAIALVIAGCATPSAQKPPSTPAAQAAPEALPMRRAMTPAPSKETEFLYELLTPSALGLARVFDDGSRTYVLFETNVPAGLMVFDENGKALTFSEGDQAVLIDTVRRAIGGNTLDSLLACCDGTIPNVKAVDAEQALRLCTSLAETAEPGQLARGI